MVEVDIKVIAVIKLSRQIISNTEIQCISVSSTK